MTLNSRGFVFDAQVSRAIEMMLCHWDGYTLNRNNWRVFHDLDSTGWQSNCCEGNYGIAIEDLLHHMLIVGQSGSGKSFLIAHLIEEILLRTRARVVVIDPNGDFRRISDAAPSEAWTSFTDSFARLVHPGSTVPRSRK